MHSPVTLRYLGAAGWHLTASGSSLLIDPYFTRLPLWKLLAGPAIPDRTVVETHTPPTDGVLVTHPHYDHIMDVPDVARITNATIYTSQQGCELLTILGVSARQIRLIRVGDHFRCGAFEVLALPSEHRRIFGRVPWQGKLKSGLRPPLRAADYRMDRQFSFYIVASNLSILVASGIDSEPSIEADVLLIGADASREQLATILNQVRPRLVFPNHWDDMFRPLSQPARPMIRPPASKLAIPVKRIDMSAFVRQLQQLQPDIHVMLPRRSEAYELTGLLDGHA